jgi:hypothetical protein
VTDIGAATSASRPLAGLRFVLTLANRSQRLPLRRRTVIVREIRRQSASSDA